MVACRRLGQTSPARFDDFLLCLVAQGGLSPESGWRASRLAVAGFVQSFLASDEIDVLWRLREAVAASDTRLAAASADEHLSSVLTAVFVAFDGTAYGVSVGDLPLVVVSPALKRGRVASGARTVLGHEPGMAIGAGALLSGARAGVIEEWWPTLEDGGTRLSAGTSLLLGGGLAGFAADGSTSAVLSEGASGIVVRFIGGQVVTSRLVAHGGWLVCVSGWRSGSGAFGWCCLSDTVVAGFVGAVLEVDPPLLCSNGLEQSFTATGGDWQRSRLAVAAWDASGGTGVLAAGGASVETAYRGPGGADSESESEGRPFTLRLGAASDPLDRGLLIAFEPDELPKSAGERVVPRWRRWLAGWRR